jgi:hypothetical protein
VEHVQSPFREARRSFGNAPGLAHHAHDWVSLEILAGTRCRVCASASDPGRSGTPPGVQRGFGAAFRGYRFAQPPATVLGPSGAVVRETGGRRRWRRWLDDPQFSGGA